MCPMLPGDVFVVVVVVVCLFFTKSEIVRIFIRKSEISVCNYNAIMTINHLAQFPICLWRNCLCQKAFVFWANWLIDKLPVSHFACFNFQLSVLCVF